VREKRNRVIEEIAFSEKGGVGGCKHFVGGEGHSALCQSGVDRIARNRTKRQTKRSCGWSDPGRRGKKKCGFGTPQLTEELNEHDHDAEGGRALSDRGGWEDPGSRQDEPPENGRLGGDWNSWSCKKKKKKKDVGSQTSHPEVRPRSQIFTQERNIPHWESSQKNQPNLQIEDADGTWKREEKKKLNVEIRVCSLTPFHV